MQFRLAELRRPKCVEWTGTHTKAPTVSCSVPEQHQSMRFSASTLITRVSHSASSMAPLTPTGGMVYPSTHLPIPHYMQCKANNSDGKASTQPALTASKLKFRP